MGWRLALIFFICVFFLFASHSEKLAISTREPSWKARDLHSRVFSLCAAFSIRQPFWKAHDFFSRAILKSSRSPFARIFFERSVLYSRAFLCAQHFLFASHSEKLTISIRAPFWKALRLSFFGFAQWNISIVVIYISLPLCQGESDISFKKTFCLMNIRPQDLLSHESTLLVYAHYLSKATKSLNKCR